MNRGHRAAIRWLIPISFLAMALQICLPIVIVRAMASAFDPLDGVTLCHASSTDDGQNNNSDHAPTQHHHGVCPLCPNTASTHFALLSVAA